MNMKRSSINVLVMIGFIFGFINLLILICDKFEILNAMCRSFFFISDLIKKIYRKEFPLTIANVKNTWLVRGRIQGRLHRYLPFFLVFKTEFTFSFSYRCRATTQLYEKNYNSPPLIFNEPQANYMERKINCKTTIFNELQLYEINCNNISIQKNQVAEM